MEYRQLGRTDMRVSAISFGAWAIGGTWGPVDKAGRRLPEQTPQGYTRENLHTWVDRSLENLEMDAVDLLQLHCPHPRVYDMPEVFGLLDDGLRPLVHSSW